MKEKSSWGRQKIYKSFNLIIYRMKATIETLHQDLVHLKKDMEYLKNVLSEDFELSEYAKKSLKEARETPESEYADLE